MSDNILGPKVLQRVEGGILLVLAVLLYATNGGRLMSLRSRATLL